MNTIIDKLEPNRGTSPSKTQLLLKSIDNKLKSKQTLFLEINGNNVLPTDNEHIFRLIN
jgi:hypothetical protein